MRLPYILLAAVLVVSFGLNARMAANPRTDYQSADERAYGKLAVDIAENRHYHAGMAEPLHWPPGAPMLFAATYKVFGDESDKEDYDIPVWAGILPLATTLGTLEDDGRLLDGVRPSPAVLSLQHRKL